MTPVVVVVALHRHRPRGLLHGLGSVTDDLLRAVVHAAAWRAVWTLSLPLVIVAGACAVVLRVFLRR